MGGRQGPQNQQGTEPARVDPWGPPKQLDLRQVQADPWAQLKQQDTKSAQADLQEKSSKPSGVPVMPNT